MKSPDVVWQGGAVAREARERRNGQCAAVVWFTGLPCSGKSTVAHTLERRLFEAGHHVYVLDGDNVRHGLCGDLSFSIEDRNENIRRVAEVAALICDAGVIVLTAFISPLRAERNMARGRLPQGRFFEVFCDADVAVCEQRDVKGLYQRARLGEIENYTGVSSPYEEPLRPELRLDTVNQSVRESADEVYEMLRVAGMFEPPGD